MEQRVWPKPGSHRAIPDPGWRAVFGNRGDAAGLQLSRISADKLDAAIQKDELLDPAWDRSSRGSSRLEYAEGHRAAQGRRHGRRSPGRDGYYRSQPGAAVPRRG